MISRLTAEQIVLRAEIRRAKFWKDVAFCVIAFLVGYAFIWGILAL